MAPTNYYRQTNREPLFANLFWSKPENKLFAGKLLVLGGNRFGFAAPAQAYAAAGQAGAGEVRAVLPDAVQKVVSGFFEHALFLPSTPSGSLAQKALPELCQAAAWADAVLLAGDIGKNAETTITIESFLSEYKGQTILTKDVISSLQEHPGLLLDRDNTTVILTLQQLQKLASNSKFAHAFTFEMPHQQLVERLQLFTKQHPVRIVLKRLKQVFVAEGGSISVTQLEADKDIWRIEQASHASVWLIQNPQKSFEALTCAVFDVFGNQNAKIH